jgi:hypothetical protein
MRNGIDSLLMWILTGLDLPMFFGLIFPGMYRIFLSKGVNALPPVRRNRTGRKLDGQECIEMGRPLEQEFAGTARSLVAGWRPAGFLRGSSSAPQYAKRWGWMGFRRCLFDGWAFVLLIRGFSRPLRFFIDFQ